MVNKSLSILVDATENVQQYMEYKTPYHNVMLGLYALVEAFLARAMINIS